MAETVTKAQGRRKEVVGEVVSNRMHKTIVVEVVRKKAHPFYGRVVSKAKKFYAHDEKNEAHIGDVVRLEETRPAFQAEALAAEGNCAPHRAGAGSGCRRKSVRSRELDKGD